MDGLFAFPFILLSLLLVTIWDGRVQRNPRDGIGSVPRFARVVRSKVIVAKNEEVLQRRARAQLLTSVLWCSTSSEYGVEVVVYATLCVGGSIIAEAGPELLV